MAARTRGQRGFTLLEILVALAVLALAMAGLIDAASSQARNTAYLVDRTLAQWVAANVVAGMRLEQAVPEVGESEDRATMGGRDWYWTAVASETEDPELLRVEVAVRAKADDGQPVTTLVTYLAAPGRSAP